MKILTNKKIEEILKVNGKGYNLTQGAVRISNEYLKTRRYNTNTLILEEIVGERNYKDMLDFLKEMGINEILLANKSSEALGLIYWFLMQGAKVVGAEEIEEREEWPFQEKIIKKAIKIKIK